MGTFFPQATTPTPAGPDAGFPAIPYPDTEATPVPEGAYLPVLTVPASVESPVWTP
jgi:hypothetical protein